MAMPKLIYRVVEHDGGWAYKLGEVFSETFPSHDDAREAAEQAAEEQRLAGDDVEIEWEDEAGRWRAEHSDGDDRPETDVEG